MDKATSADMLIRSAGSRTLWYRMSVSRDDALIVVFATITYDVNNLSFWSGGFISISIQVVSRKLLHDRRPTVNLTHPRTGQAPAALTALA
jgi:hypothetical protein